jgi:hypothetical protein
MTGVDELERMSNPLKKLQWRWRKAQAKRPHAPM